MLPRLRDERAVIERDLAQADVAPRVVVLHPTLVADYLKHVDALQETLTVYGRQDDEPTERLVMAFRALIESVTIFPGPPHRGFEVEVRGKLSELIGEPAFPDSRVVGDRLSRTSGTIFSSGA